MGLPHYSKQKLSLEKPTWRARQRFDLVVSLKAVIAKRKSWQDVEKLLEEPETLV